MSFAFSNIVRYPKEKAYDSVRLGTLCRDLHLCRFKSPTFVGDSSGKVTLPRAFSMREGVNI